MQQGIARERANGGPGDPPPAEAFVAAHLPRVLRFATMVSPPGADPRDLAQEAMVRALEHLDRFDPDRGSAEGWLWRIVVNLARDAGRLAGRRELLVERLAADVHPGAEPSAEAAALDRMRDRHLALGSSPGPFLRRDLVIR